MLSKEWLDDTTLRVMTYKSGSFTFRLAVDMAKLSLITKISRCEKIGGIGLFGG